MRLYLASTSPARLQLLRAAGVAPVVLPSGVDEQQVVAEHELAHGRLTPAELVQVLARAKAEAVLRPRVHDDSKPDHPFTNFPNPDGIHSGDIDGIVLGGDSVFVVDGVIYGKPGTAEAAQERWRSQNGRSGTLWSGHWVIDHRGGQVNTAIGRAASATVSFANLDDAEISAYVATEEPLAVAGAFTVDSLGGPFIRSIAGDPSTVVGLSLSTLRELVRELGISWTALWT